MRRRLRKTVLLWSSLLFASGAGALRLQAQGVRLGVIMDEPRTVLEQAWTEDPRQVERAYCVTHWSFGVYQVTRTMPIQKDTVFRVFGVKPADVKAAGPASAEFECPPGVPELHIHTPTTCAGDDLNTCIVGGLNAYSCQPSRNDLEKLTSRGDAFGVIQCDRRSFRFYYAFEYVGVSTVSSTASPRPRPQRMTVGGGVHESPH